MAVILFLSRRLQAVCAALLVLAATQVVLAALARPAAVSSVRAPLR